MPLTPSTPAADDDDTQILRTTPHVAASGLATHALASSGAIEPLVGVTRFAERALGLADVFQILVGGIPVASCDGAGFRVSLTVPAFGSTGGGTQRLQHVTLVRGTTTLVVGSIDIVARSLELRSFEDVAMDHERRSRSKLPIRETEMSALSGRIRAFARRQELVVRIRPHGVGCDEHRHGWQTLAALAAGVVLGGVGGVMGLLG